MKFLFIEINMKLHLSTLVDYLRFMHGINNMSGEIILDVKKFPVLMLTKTINNLKMFLLYEMELK